MCHIEAPTNIPAVMLWHSAGHFLVGPEEGFDLGKNLSSECFLSRRSAPFITNMNSEIIFFKPLADRGPLDAAAAALLGVGSRRDRAVSVPTVLPHSHVLAGTSGPSALG